MRPPLRHPTAVLALSLALGLGCGAPPPPPASGATAAAAPAIEELHALRPVVDTTGFAGVVLVYDVRRDRFRAVHAERADGRLVPASTFKVLNSLVALETGVVAGPQAVLP